jgi:hypothetical protein
MKPGGRKSAREVRGTKRPIHSHNGTVRIVFDDATTILLEQGFCSFVLYFGIAKKSPDDPLSSFSPSRSNLSENPSVPRTMLQRYFGLVCS